MAAMQVPWEAGQAGVVMKAYFLYAQLPSQHFKGAGAYRWRHISAHVRDPPVPVALFPVHCVA